VNYQADDFIENVDLFKSKLTSIKYQIKIRNKYNYIPNTANI